MYLYTKESQALQALIREREWELQTLIKEREQREWELQALQKTEALIEEKELQALQETETLIRRKEKSLKILRKKEKEQPCLS